MSKRDTSDAIDELAALFEFGALQAATDPAGFMRTTAAEIKFLRAEVAAVTRERDLAIAHDRQPYPTAEAYETLAKAHVRRLDQVHGLEAERDQLRAEVERLNRALEAECDGHLMTLARAQRLEAALREAHERARRIRTIARDQRDYGTESVALALIGGIDAALAEESKP